MKAKIRALIVLAVLCVFLPVIYILIPDGKFAASKPGQPAGQNKPPAPVLITDIPVNEVKAMALSNEYVTLGILNTPEGITAMPGAGKPFSPEQMRALIYKACHLTALRLLDNHPLPQKSETEKAPARFSLILSDGREYNFILLGKSSVDNNYLLYSEGQESVFLISEENARWFLANADNL